MATRRTLIERVPGGIKQKNMAAEGARVNRRALGDIGNLVPVRGACEGKLLPDVSRPTSFRAQLLAKAKEAAAARNNKKFLPVNGEGAAAIPADGVLPNGGKASKPAEKNAVIKPKTEVLIERSTDSAQTKELKNKKTGGVLPRKKASTLTNTLTARSKVACGLNQKPNLQIVDIDAADANNELAVVEYVEDLYKFYKLSENDFRVDDYMHSQPEINKRMRAILIDWLTEVHHKFKLYPETLYLTVHIIDRYLAVKTTLRKELQLLGMSAMLVASKYEEIWAPPVSDFICISDGTYAHEQILAMEKSILSELQWNLTVPTPYVFLLRFIKASIPDSYMENMAYFLAELGMMNYATSLYPPSMIAASAVYAARCTLNKSPFWDETLKLHTGFSEKQLMECAKLLVSFHAMAMAAENTLKASYKKYSSSERGAVALFPPAKSLLAIPA